jgi:predicted HAD superfamily Cof-like phosphohydrolase
MFKNELDAVADFQTRFETELLPAGTHRKDVPLPVVQLNRRINVEELEETITKGVLAGDLVQVADGCADTLYTLAHAVNQMGRVPNAGMVQAAQLLLCEALARVDFSLKDHPAMLEEKDIDRNLSYAEIIVRGVAAVYGIPLDKCFEEVHRSNMTKIWEDGKGRKDAGGKVTKPPTYSRADLQPILEKFGQPVAGGIK